MLRNTCGEQCPFTVYHCGWSPFMDYTFPAAVVHTIINGETVFEDGVLKEQLPIGSKIEFNR